MSQTSSDELLESLSAFVDNEAGELEVHRLLKSVATDTRTREAWRRYHVIGTVMRKEGPFDASIDLSERIAQAIGQEESYSNEADSQIHGVGGRTKDTSGRSIAAAGWRWKDTLGKSAIAASVALALVVGVQQFPGSDDVGGQSVVQTPTDLSPVQSPVSNAPVGFDIPMPAARTVSSNALGGSSSVLVPMQSAQQSGDARWLDDPELQERLNQLLIQHAERASGNGSLGLLPFARVSRLDPAEEKK